MKLHLPKLLLTAVLAAVMMPTAWAANDWSADNNGTYYIDNETNQTIDATGQNYTSFVIWSDTGSENNTPTNVTVTEMKLKAGDAASVATGTRDNSRTFDAITFNDIKVADGGAAILNVDGGNKAVINSISEGTLRHTIAEGGTLVLNTDATYSTSDCVQGAGTLEMASGKTLTMDYENARASVSSNIKLNAGSTLNLTKNDALGWGSEGTSPKLISLTGSSESSKAVINLQNSTSQTWASNLEMNGNTSISGGTIVTYSQTTTENLTFNVSGTDNTISSQINMRRALALNVAEEGELVISGLVQMHTWQPSAQAAITKLGAGKVTFTNSDNTFGNVYTNAAGSTIFAKEDTAESNAVNTFNSGIVISGGNVTFEAGVDIRLGSAIELDNDGTLNFNGNALAITSLGGFEFNINLDNFSATENGLAALEVSYTLVTGNTSGVSGTVKLNGSETATALTDGKAIGNSNFYVVVDDSQYSTTMHEGANECEGILVTNKAIFDLQLTGDNLVGADLYVKDATITNTKSSCDPGKKTIKHLALLGDSKVLVTADKQFGMVNGGWAESVLDLGGNTLTKTGEGIFHMVNTTSYNGSIDIEQGTLLVDSKTDYFSSGTTLSNVVINVQNDGTLKISGMKDALTIGNVLTSTTGTGRIEVSANAFIQGTKRRDVNSNILVNAPAPTTTLFEGDLVINNGATLSIGHNASGHQWGYYTNLNSLRSLELAGGNVYYNGEGNVIKSLVTSATSIFHVENMGDDERIQFESVTLNADLNLTSYWASRVDLGALTGTGNLIIKSNGKPGEDTDVNVTVAKGYSGTISMVNNAENAGDGSAQDSTNGLTVDIIVDKAATLQDTQLVNNTTAASVTLKGEGTYKITTPATAVKNGLTAAAWTGTVSLSGEQSGVNLNDYGHSGSTVELSSATGSLAEDTINTNVKFTSGTSGGNATPGMRVTETTGKTVTFAGSVTSNGENGNLVVEDPEASNSGTDTYVFQGDVSGWTGKVIGASNVNVKYEGNATTVENDIAVANNSTVNVTYGGDKAVTVNGYVDKTPWGGATGTINVKVENTSSKGVTFTNTVEVTSTNLAAGTTAAFNGTSDLGSLTLGAGASVTGSGNLTIGELVLNLQTYTTDYSKEYTLVSTSGTLNFTGSLDAYTDVDLGDYTANVTFADNSLTLNFTPEQVLSSITATVLDKDPIWDGKTLTLTVDDNLDGVGSVIIEGFEGDLLDKIFALDGMEANTMVGITLVGADGKELSAVPVDDISNIGFRGNDGIYYGQNVDGSTQYNVSYIPEPTTATLSLLALMGLAARRRRK